MCGSGLGHGHGGEVGTAAPRVIEGDAVDPVAIEPFDEVMITALVDNSYDGLLTDMGPARRAAMGRTPRVSAPHSSKVKRCLAWWPSTGSPCW